MGLKFTGFEHMPAPQQKAPEVVASECPDGEKTGCFLWDYDSQDDKVKFTTKILVRNDLSKSELKDVLAHERQHWSDFNRRASEVKAAAIKAEKEGKDTAIDDRLEWMMYDYCQDAAAYHRRLGRISFDWCREPRSKRP